MSGLVRRVVISATATGLLLQPHGHSEHHKPLLIDFKSQQLTEYVESKQQSQRNVPQLDVHGLIGFVSIASLSYLIAITKREEVAQIAGKPVYLVADVALLPLTSQQEASDAIKNALVSSDTDSDESDSEVSDSEDTTSSKTTATELGSTPGDDLGSFQGKNDSNTSVAQDVATGNVSFGRFATQWLSRQRWPASNTSVESSNKEVNVPGRTTTAEPSVEPEESTPANQPSDIESAAKSLEKDKQAAGVATMGLLSRILRTTKMVFTSRSYFFSYDIDLTRRFEKLGRIDQPLNLRNLDPLYFWNRKLGARLLDSNFSNFLTPVLQGFVGQRAFTLSKSTPDDLANAEVQEAVEEATQLSSLPSTNGNQQAFLLTLISRRSTKRSGLRYLRRGIDDEGNCANFVESEQILSSADWDLSKKIRTFVQVRGSIPLYFSQSPYSFKPAVVFHNSPQMNERAYSKHFSALKKQYGAVQVALLVDHHRTEKPIGDAFEEMYKKTQTQDQPNDVSFHWFDFHAECRGMKFENVSGLVDTLTPFLSSSSETTIESNTVTSRQTGVIRTNCMDCLDRTNVAQSAFAQQILQTALSEEGFQIDFTTDPSTNWFNTLWADNGDAVSRLYAGTAALKGDYTRTRKRNWRGAINDFGLTLTRYYGNMVNDYFSQTVIDMLLGNVSWRVFEDFESSMMSADPGISVSSARESAIDSASKIVIVDPEKEDLLHAWTVMVPAVENTLRTLPMEEAVVLLSDAALYVCRMDWTTEKVARVERVDIRGIRKVKVGTYVVSTFTERQMDEELNQGLVVYYVPGREDVVRVNTRSLSNYHLTGEDEGQSDTRGQGVDGGTGIISWLTSPSSTSTKREQRQDERILAMKVVTRSDDDFTDGENHGLARSTSNTGRYRVGTPGKIADSIADEIRRAVTGSTEKGEQRGGELIERADVIGAEEARKRTGYLEQVGWRVRKMVWA